MASYQQLREYFLANVPGAQQGVDTADWNERFNQWVSAAVAETGASSPEGIPDEAFSPDYQGPQGNATQQLDVAKYLKARPDLAQNYNADPTIKQQYATLEDYAKADFEQNKGGHEGTQFTPEWYQQFLNTTPSLSADGTPLEQSLLQTALPNLLNDVNADTGRRQTADELAAQLLSSTNAAQGALTDATSGRLLEQDYANADKTTAANVAAVDASTKTQLQALADATAAMQQNLTGDAAAKAAALQQQIASLNQNLDQLDATQRQAIKDQIASLQQNLEQSITTQRQALTDQISALQGAAGAQADAQRQALTAELAGLTAAQAPLAAARTKAAELQGTAVNAGLQSTQDQLRADAARQGFVGGSTMQDAALARASIDARQQAAQALGGAQVANASDTRDIAVRGATGERTIAEALAQAQHDITGQGAAGNAGLTVAGATGKQGILDAGAAGNAALTNQTALSRAGIGAQGANTSYADQVMTADQRRSILDALAQGNANVTGTGAAQTLAAQQAGAAQRSGYYDADYARRVAAGLTGAGLAGNTAATLTGLDDYANSGLTRTQNSLNWWANPTTAPTPGALATQPSTAGNSLSNLGSSLIGAGINWFQSNPRSTAANPVTPTPVKSIYDYTSPTATMLA